MKIGVCCVGRLENKYAREFVEHYLSLGFDNIILYDNNEVGEDDFRDVIGDYIQNGKVIWNLYNHKHGFIQKEIYYHCWETYKNSFDWLAFFDFDEFLTLTSHLTIKEYLADSIFYPYDMIHINWMGYDDNDLVYYDSRPLLERFTRNHDFNLTKQYNFPENNHIKSIIRCKNRGYVNWIMGSNMHTPSNNLRCCDNKGLECSSSSPFLSYNFDLAYLKHFSTKTIDEWLNVKLQRGFLDQPLNEDGEFNALNLDIFFKINKITEEKINFIKNFHEKSSKKYKNIDFFLKNII